MDDQTGLKGRYDYKVEWSRDPVAADPVDRLYFFLQAIEKLGLKLESRKVPTEVLIVDHAEKPSPN
ncbi:MAG: TIGR03435 family protein [Acidobacteriia bacterium]|nr:TIGR03435 family protein [Terriglobia bacterium]